MPPRKKARISDTTSPAPPDKPAAPSPDEDADADEAAARDAENVNDPWTDDEEIGLFKGLIRWKPTGIHKHMNILSLRRFLLTNGYIHELASHTRIPGIWAKLNTLYDLPALDEREDSNSTLFGSAHGSDDGSGDEEDSDDDVDSAAAGGVGDGFELPDEEFGDLMWRQRFADADSARPTRERQSKDSQARDRSSSPPAAPECVARPDSPPMRFIPTVDVGKSEDPEEEQEATPTKAMGRKPGRPKGTANKSKARAREPNVRRKSTRGADSLATEEEQKEEEEEEEEDEEGEDEEEVRDSEDASSEEESGTPAPRPSRGRGGGRSRGRPSRGKRRR